MQWNDNLMSRRVVLSLWRFMQYARCHMRPCRSRFYPSTPSMEGCDREKRERHGRMWQRAYRVNLQRDRTTLLLIKLSFHCFIYLFIYIFTYLFIHLLISFFISLFISLFLYMFISLHLYFFISLLFIYLFI